jgi:hypothetical protein
MMPPVACRSWGTPQGCKFEGKILVGLDITMLTTPQTDANSSAPVWQIIEAGMEIPTTIPFLEPPPDDARHISSSASLEIFVEPFEIHSLNLPQTNPRQVRR